MTKESNTNQAPTPAMTSNPAVPPGESSEASSSPDLRGNNLVSWAQQRRNLLAGIALTILLILMTLILGIILSGRFAADKAPVASQVSGAQLLQESLAAVGRGETTAIRIVDAPLTDADLQRLAGNKIVESLQIDAGEISDSGLDVLTTLPSLHELRLRHSPITDQGLQAIARISSLRYLNLPQSACTPDGITALQSLPVLRGLRLGSSRPSPNFARAIADLTSLRAVHLIDLPINDNGVELLATMPNLESLYLDGAAVTDEGWSWVFRNHPQLHVHINQQHHDNDPRKHSHHSGH